MQTLRVALSVCVLVAVPATTFARRGRTPSHTTVAAVTAPPTTTPEPHTPPVVTESADIARARALFQQGTIAFNEGRAADALMFFEATYRLHTHAALLFNMGMALQTLGRFVEARDRLLEFLKVANDRQRAQLEAHVRGMLAEVNQRIGTIHVAALFPGNARIIVDERVVVPDGNQNIAVDPGRHTLVIEATGYETGRETISMQVGGMHTLRVRLVPPEQWPQSETPVEPTSFNAP